MSPTQPKSNIVFEQFTNDAKRPIVNSIQLWSARIHNSVLIVAPATAFWGSGNGLNPTVGDILNLPGVFYFRSHCTRCSCVVVIVRVYIYESCLLVIEIKAKMLPKMIVLVWSEIIHSSPSCRKNTNHDCVTGNQLILCFLTSRWETL